MNSELPTYLTLNYGTIASAVRGWMSVSVPQLEKQSTDRKDVKSIKILGKQTNKETGDFHKHIFSIF